MQVTCYLDFLGFQKAQDQRALDSLLGDYNKMLEALKKELKAPEFTTQPDWDKDAIIVKFNLKPNLTIFEGISLIHAVGTLQLLSIFYKFPVRGVLIKGDDEKEAAKLEKQISSPCVLIDDEIIEHIKKVLNCDERQLKCIRECKVLFKDGSEVLRYIVNFCDIEPNQIKKMKNHDYRKYSQLDPEKRPRTFNFFDIIDEMSNRGNWENIKPKWNYIKEFITRFGSREFKRLLGF